LLTVTRCFLDHCLAILQFAIDAWEFFKVYKSGGETTKQQELMNSDESALKPMHRNFCIKEFLKAISMNMNS
jgi:hypothetical protein